MNSDFRTTKFDTALAAKILDDSVLCTWFFELCIGRRPTVKVSEDTMSTMQRHGFVVKADSGLKLGPAGEAFARALGLIREKTPLDLVPELLEHLSGGISKVAETQRTDDYTNEKEKGDDSQASTTQ